ncbi:MAG: hypothetical protein IKF47_00805 [Bacilli bacterium]|nr:hypothetical protein [Bacilli bacterium]
MINTVNPIMTAIRSIFVVTDLSIYWLLGFIYELFFNIATFNIVDREMVFNIFSRVQLVVGVYMMFQLILIIIKGIVNPDSFTDSKTGAGNLIMRIIVSLSLLALLVPINIPSPKNEYEKQINNSGLLFGTLYSLQYRILANNTLGNLILGRDSEYGNPTSTKPTSRPLAKFSDRFVGAIVKTFYQLNVDETTGEYVCDDGFDEEYNKVDTSPFLIIAKGMVGCNNSSWPGKPYVLTMTFLISSIAGIVLCVLMFMMCFEVAKRVFQLAALQLLAPIPIISYMDPKGSKDGAFNSWLKLLGTTYLDLFTRLAVIYFTLFIIDGFIDKFFSKVGELAVTSYSGDFLAGHLLTKWTFIIMCIALFIFAKDAPKFFKQMLGIKGDGKFFSAFGDAIGLAGSAAGAIGSFNSGRKANWDADQARVAESAKQRFLKKHPGMSQEEAAARGERYARMFGHGAANKAKNNVSGVLSAGRSLMAGSAAASESKGNAYAKYLAARNAQHENDMKTAAAGRNGSTAVSGIGSLVRETFTGRNAYDTLDTKLKNEEQKIKDKELVLKRDADINAFKKSIMDRVNSKALESDKVKCDVDLGSLLGSAYQFTDTSGNVHNLKIGGSYRHWNSVSSAALESGAATFDYEWVDSSGATQKVTIRREDIKDIDISMQDTAKESYYVQSTTNSTFDSEVWENKDSYEKASKKTIESGWGGSTGIKARFGEENRRINRENAELSKQREAINQKRQGYEGQKALHDSKFGRKG